MAPDRLIGRAIAVHPGSEDGFGQLDGVVEVGSHVVVEEEDVGEVAGVLAEPLEDLGLLDDPVDELCREPRP